MLAINAKCVVRERESSNKVVAALNGDPVHVGQEGDAGCGENGGHDPHAHELLVQDHPGQQVHKGGVGSKESGHHRAVQMVERGDVEIVGDDRHQTEHEAAGEEQGRGDSRLAELRHGVPEHGHVRVLPAHT